MNGARFDESLANDLALRAAEGDAAARHALVEALWPEWIDLVRRSRFMGPLAASDEHVRSVAGDLVEKLERDEGRALALYRAWRGRNPDKSFADWNRIVCANAVRSYVRGILGGAEATFATNPGVKSLLNDLEAAAPEPSTRPPFTNLQTAREAVELASRKLGEEPMACLLAWVEGATFEEIQVERGLPSPDDARRIVRAAVAVLRRELRAD